MDGAVKSVAGLDKGQQRSAVSQLSQGTPEQYWLVQFGLNLAARFISHNLSYLKDKLKYFGFSQCSSSACSSAYFQVQLFHLSSNPSQSSHAFWRCLSSPMVIKEFGQMAQGEWLTLRLVKLREESYSMWFSEAMMEVCDSRRTRTSTSKLGAYANAIKYDFYIHAVQITQ